VTTPAARASRGLRLRPAPLHQGAIVPVGCAFSFPKDRAQVMHVTGALRISHEAGRPRGGVTTIIRPPAHHRLHPAQTRSVPGAGLPLPHGGGAPRSPPRADSWALRRAHQREHGPHPCCAVYTGQLRAADAGGCCCAPLGDQDSHFLFGQWLGEQIALSRGASQGHKASPLSVILDALTARVDPRGERLSGVSQLVATRS